MKYKNECAYKDICNNFNCKNCELKYIPYDKLIAVQIKRDANKSRAIQEQNDYDLAQEILARK